MSHTEKEKTMESNILNDIARTVAFREAQRQEDFIKHITPRWWQWCVEKGGIFRWFAKSVIKIVVVERR